MNQKNIDWEKMHKIIFKDLPKGFPIFAALIRNNNIIDFEWNKKSTLKLEEWNKLKHTNHAEWILDYSKNINENDFLLITLPPCSKCFEKLKKLKIKKIIYLFDPEEKTKKNYLKNIDINKINDLENKLIKENLKLYINKIQKKSHEFTRKKYLIKFNNLKNILYN